MKFLTIGVKPHKRPKLISLRYILNGPQWKLQKQFLFMVKESWIEVWLPLKSGPNFRYPLPRVWKIIHTEKREVYYCCSSSSSSLLKLLLSSGAAQLAISENWRHVILEGDSKICFDSIAGKYQSVDWSISAIIDNIHSLVASFAVCSFSWINRSCNSCCCQVISSLLLVSLLSF